MSSTANSTPVQRALEHGATVLAPTVRSARELSRAFDAAQRAAGHTSWQPARVFSWGGWTSSLWNTAIVAGTVDSVLLNGLQEDTLWQRVLDGTDDLGLQATGPAARLCGAAMKLLGSYDLADRFSHEAPLEGTDAAAFTRWYGEFMALCHAERLLPSSHLDAELANLIRTRTITADAVYILYGFDSVTPAQNALVDALRSAGSAVESMQPSAQPIQPAALLSFEDPQAEIDACCRWVQDTLAGTPDARIAVVVPDLDSVRADLERGLREAAAPWTNDVTQSHHTTPFEFSTGRPLAHLPMVADALLLLRWLTGPLPFADAGAVLRSRFLTLSPSPEEGAELEAWTLLDRRRIRASATLSGDVSLREAQSMLQVQSPAAARAMDNLLQQADRSLGRAETHADFADAVRALLSKAGWLSGTVDSAEFQAAERWNEMLDSVATLDIFGDRVSFPEWFATVERAARETLFAPENMGAPVQVMTVNEAAGIAPDAMWFLHAGDSTWPPRRDPNPLLPRLFQRALRMPGSDVEIDEAAMQQVIAHRVAAAGISRFSFASHGPQGEQHPSAMIEQIAVAQSAPDNFSTTLPPLQLEALDDDLPLADLPEHAAGGVSVVASQALCGFRAFAERRLQIAEMDSVDAGLSPAERGEQIHAILQCFWKRCKNQKQLLSWMRESVASGVNRRDQVLQECINATVPPLEGGGWDASYVAVQRRRLHRLLSDWFDVEAERTPFEVAQMEFCVPSAQLGPLRLNLRVDRIDRVDTPDGPVSVLIDYKTGNAERSDWFGDRPDAPQLPVYAIAGGIPDVHGIAFARVRIGSLGMNFEEMLSDRSLLGDAVTKRRSGPGFDERMEEWTRDLAALANAFARGEAAIQPKDYLTTCKNCASRLLCRVDVSRLEPDDDLLEEAEDEGAQ